MKQTDQVRATTLIMYRDRETATAADGDREGQQTVVNNEGRVTKD
jgi:hypothetical protein